MVSIFNFEDYRAFLKARLREFPKEGYGQSKRLADHLGVHTTLISQILLGTKELSVDHAVLAADFFLLNELETECFVALVHLGRAGNPTSRKFATKQLSAVKQKASEISRRVSATGKLNEEQRAIFYSHWLYSAVRQLSAIPSFQTLEAIASHLQLPPKTVKECLDFLIATGLCKEERGRLTIGPSSTHLGADSIWARAQHVNWRQKAINVLDVKNPQNLHYTAPMTLGEKDIAVVRESLIRAIESVNAVVDPSPSETSYTLNIDWFKF